MKSCGLNVKNRIISKHSKRMAEWLEFGKTSLSRSCLLLFLVVWEIPETITNDILDTQIEFWPKTSAFALIWMKVDFVRLLPPADAMSRKEFCWIFSFLSLHRYSFFRRVDWDLPCCTSLLKGAIHVAPLTRYWFHLISDLFHSKLAFCWHETILISHRIGPLLSRERANQKLSRHFCFFKWRCSEIPWNKLEIVYAFRSSWVLHRMRSGCEKHTAFTCEQEAIPISDENDVL